MTERRLETIRAAIQNDVCNRGLGSDPNENLFTVFADDFAAACHSVAKDGKAIAIVTGFYIPSANPPAAETDGPLGVLFLARALVQIGMRVVIFAEDFCRNAFQTASLAELASGVQFHTLPNRTENWNRFIENDWLPWAKTEFGMTHLVAIERPGPNHAGRYLNMRGGDITDFHSPAHLLFEAADEYLPAVTTVGIGDGGNEIGMGKIPAEIIARNISNGREIRCCLPTDHLIVSGISNWGAYGLAAGVRLLRDRPMESEHFSIELEKSILQQMVQHGPLVDGVIGRREATVDGIAFERYAEPLRGILEIF